MSKKEIYFSIDIEADGPIPGAYSMLSFAAVAFEVLDNQYYQIDTFSANLERLDDAKQHPDTMTFWAQNNMAYDTTRINTVSAKVAMPLFATWVAKCKAKNKPIFVGYPAVYDFKWIDWYLYMFVGNNIFGFSALDMKSYANALLKHKHFSSTAKKTMPRDWFSDLPHTHVALDDALEQAHLFFSMRASNLKIEGE